MDSIIRMQYKLKKLLDPKRYNHSIGVKMVAIKLSLFYNEHNKKAAIAGLVHDVAKNIPRSVLLKKANTFGILEDDIIKDSPELLHGPVGSVLAREYFGICDKEILEAIYNHTLGSSTMSLLDKIIFLADYIEPSRDYPGIELIREYAFKDLNIAIILSIDSTINYLKKNNKPIHPKTLKTRMNLVEDSFP